MRRRLFVECFSAHRRSLRGTWWDLGRSIPVRDLQQRHYRSSATKRTARNHNNDLQQTVRKKILKYYTADAMLIATKIDYLISPT